MGDSIKLFDGSNLVIEQIAVVPGRTTVYNFEVEDYHTYYVSHTKVLVHNFGPCDDAAPNVNNGKFDAGNAGRGLWTLTKEGASSIKNHKTFGTIYKSSSDGLWWAMDKAGHGGSKFKVFKEGRGGLEWFKDADEFGDFISNKHKGSTGTFIPWGKLSTVK